MGLTEKKCVFAGVTKTSYSEISLRDLTQADRHGEIKKKPFLLILPSSVTGSYIQTL
jgi:hypothetical protein